MPFAWVLGVSIFLASRRSPARFSGSVKPGAGWVVGQFDCNGLLALWIGLEKGTTTLDGCFLLLRHLSGSAWGNLIGPVSPRKPGVVNPLSGQQIRHGEKLEPGVLPPG